jgi:hypothetical protein
MAETQALGNADGAGNAAGVGRGRHKPPGNPDSWTPKEKEQFRVEQSEDLCEGGTVTNKEFGKALGELMKRPLLGEGLPDKVGKERADASAEEKAMAFEYFRCMPKEVLTNQIARSKEFDRIAKSIADPLGRKWKEMRRRLSGYVEEFLGEK